MITLLNFHVGAFQDIDWIKFILISCVFLCIIGLIAFLEYYATRRVRIAEVLAAEHRRRKEDIEQEEEKQHL